MANRALVARGPRGHADAEAAGAEFGGIVVRPLKGTGPERDLYALLPPGGRHPLAEPTLHALREVASELT